MDTTRVTTFRFCQCIIALCIILGVPFAYGQDYRVGSLRIERPWATATPQGAKVGAGYITIVNDGSQADRLIGITSPDARKVTIHSSVKEGDVVKMRALDKGLEIKPGETVEMKPNGTHVMFENLRAPLLKAARVQSTLIFEKAGIVDVDFTIEPMGTKARSPVAPAHQH